MSEVQTEVQSAPNRQEITIQPSQLVGSMFGVEPETPAAQPVTPPAADTPIPAQTATPATDTVTATPAAPPPDEEVVEPEVWLKNEFGWENTEAAKKEIQELRKLREAKPQDLTFANEESRKVHELLKEGKVKEVTDILAQQARIDSILASEVSKDNAAEIIKTGMKLKYPSLTNDQIEFQYRQEYGIPKEPAQKIGEDDEEFEERKNEWKEIAANMEMKATIAAAMAKPEIEKAKQQIVLPDINPAPQQKPPTQEELAAAKLYAESYLKSVEDSLKAFNGFTVPVSHKDVAEFPVAYGVAEEEKSAIASQLKGFVEANYDANQLFAPRWVNADGTLKSEQMVKDLLLLNNADKAFQKLSNDSAAKALEGYIKSKKNIDVTTRAGQGVTELSKDDKTEMDQLRDKVFGQ